MTRLIFMGTPDFARPVLEELIAPYQIVAVVTQPDRPAGRGRKTTIPPVKAVALAHDLPVLQPVTLRQPQVVAQLAALAPQVIVVAAYGQILPRQVLTIPPQGCLNVHASLLPRHRGAAPVAAAILAGDEVTGVTIMLMEEGLDTGPILAQAECHIAPQDTTESLSGELALLGAALLSETLPGWLRGEIKPQPQDESQATHSPLISKQDGLLDWTQPALKLWRQVRAYHPWPGAYTYCRGKRLKILRASPLPDWAGQEKPGAVLSLPEGLAVAAAEGALLLEEVQLAGKRCMAGPAFACGQKDLIGSCLGQ